MNKLSKDLLKLCKNKAWNNTNTFPCLGLENQGGTEMKCQRMYLVQSTWKALPNTTMLSPKSQIGSTQSTWGVPFTSMMTTSITSKQSKSMQNLSKIYSSLSLELKLESMVASSLARSPTPAQLSKLPSTNLVKLRISLLSITFPILRKRRNWKDPFTKLIVLLINLISSLRQLKQWKSCKDQSTVTLSIITMKFLRELKVWLKWWGQFTILKKPGTLTMKFARMLMNWKHWLAQSSTFPTSIATRNLSNTLKRLRSWWDPSMMLSTIVSIMLWRREQRFSRSLRAQFMMFPIKTSLLKWCKLLTRSSH